MPAKKYDLIVIGAGSGLNVASRASDILGWKVAVVEMGPMGGTCLNRGCIPSKILIHSADVAETIRNSKIFGIDSKINSVNFTKIIQKATNFVDNDAENIEKALQKDKLIDLYKLKTEFLEPKILKVGKKTITAPKIVIAAGARPFIPPIKGLDKVDYLTSTEALRLKKQPKSMVIIGGGYIAAELGHFYGSLGTNVTIVDRSNLLVDKEDEEVAQKFTKIFSEKYLVYFEHDTQEVLQEKNGRKTIILKDRRGKIKKLQADQLLLTTGRRPNSDLLKLENTNVEIEERGYIQTDKYMGTTEEGVWALGDIVGKAPFKHGANMEAQVVFVNMQGKRRIPAEYEIMPHAIFSSPQIAGVGITEQEAKKRKIPYEVKKLDFDKTGMGIALGADQAFIKFIIDPKKEKILGCHILGPEASILIHEVLVVMSAAGGSLNAISKTIHIHPSLSEVVQRAF